MIKAELLGEAGYGEAILGFGLAMKPRSARIKEWWTKERMGRVEKTAIANAGRGGGHDKFLRMMQTWWLLDMPRMMSQEFSTYKIGTTSCSASTMHKLAHEPVSISFFDTDGFDDKDMGAMLSIINRMNEAIKGKDLQKAKRLNPEGYMLEQVWNASYAVIGAIIKQRVTHAMPEWRSLAECFMRQVARPEYLVPFWPKNIDLPTGVNR